MLQRLQSDWPFPAGQAPFFYGWMIWLLSTLGFLLSVPGQTMGMSVFTDSFIAVLELSRTELSTAYLLGTVLSATLLTRAGRAFDRFGARLMLLLASSGLGLVLLAMANVERVSNTLAGILAVPLPWISGPLIFLCYFGVRFTGQGVLTSASVNILLLWFERRRGLVSGVRGVFVSLGFAAAPLLLAMLMANFGWRGTLLLLAAVVGLGFFSFALLFARDRPATCGLEPDGVKSTDPAGKSTAKEAPSETLAEARRSREYWCYCLGLATHAFFGTALTFHIVDIFSAVGRPEAEAYRFFLPMAIVSTSVNLVASVIADRIAMKPILLIMLLCFIAGNIGMLNLASPLGYGLLVLGLGAGGGLWVVISNLAFVRHHGTRHLGEISGFNTAITVFASAIGPVSFSLARDFLGSYDLAVTVSALTIIILLIASTTIPNRRVHPNAPI